MSTLLTRDEQSASVAHTSGRRVGVDLARTLGLTAVVVGHLAVYDEVRALTFSWHVPLFFVLAGYLWKPSRRALPVEVASRSARALVPYLVWLPVGGAAMWWVRRALGRPLPLTDVVERSLWGGLSLVGPAAPFWFLTAFAVAVGVVALTWRMSPAVSVLVGLGGTAAVALHPGWSTWPLAVAPALVGVLLVVAGRGLRSIAPRVSRPVRVGVALVLSGLLLAGSGVSAPLDLRALDLGTPVLSLVVAVAICAGLVLVCEGAAHRLPGGVAPVVTTFAEIAVPVFLLHLAVADVLALEVRDVDRIWMAPFAVAVAVAVGLAARASSWRRFLL
ncbi:acyltransferase family protein [Nocardioides jiangxiensis]|uniref:Acyltransferase family protein n=1 Tax=Nocardioides jiangxiensis TaxID=3064524 RepID=A0ABT9B1J1_9ACTN|nr:acyltransferase family protein [Nocardioides sp. WY-20]MDO7868553.1 acyltransferase family protein [Nocardioides sp. WY-20]